MRKNDPDIQQASKFFQEKQYEQHHHLAHVSHSKEKHPTYLESLSSKYSSVDPDTKVHEPSYLETLSDLNAKKSSWVDYKMVIEHVNKERFDEREGEHVTSYQSDDMSRYISFLTSYAQLYSTQK